MLTWHLGSVFSLEDKHARYGYHGDGRKGGRLERDGMKGRDIEQYIVGKLVGLEYRYIFTGGYTHHDVSVVT